MARLTLVGGAQSNRSILANAQRCVNYYPEINRKDSPVPFTHYQRPGLVPLEVAPQAAPVRMLYRASNGAGYCVVGQGVYAIAADWTLAHLGDLAVNSGLPCRAIDNGTTLVLVDGSTSGYEIALASNAFSTIVDPTGTFVGANTVDTLDTFILWNLLGTAEFGSTLSNSVVFDALYVAAKATYPDKLQGLVVNRQQILLLGTLKSEIWYDAGNAQFPFARLPGAYIEHGCIAPYSIASEDINVYWLGQDLQGDLVVFRQRGYDTVAISNHALVDGLAAAKRAGADFSDAIGFTYQQDQHVFYVLVFPSADVTWVYDASIGDKDYAWHQWAWTDANGALHRHRANCCAFINGKNVVGDWENGQIYEMSLDAYTDTVGGTAGPISYIRGFPHMMEGTPPAGQPFALPLHADGHQIRVTQVVVDLECGNGPLDANGNPAMITLRVSQDRGKTFYSAPLQSSGAPGEYLTSPKWSQVGFGRDLVFEISHSIAGAAALNGAWVDAQVMGN